jgi:hypothetical protein
MSNTEHLVCCEHGVEMSTCKIYTPATDQAATPSEPRELRQIAVAWIKENEESNDPTDALVDLLSRQRRDFLAEVAKHVPTELSEDGEIGGCECGAIDDGSSDPTRWWRNHIISLSATRAPQPEAGGPSDEEKGGDDNCILCAQGYRHRTCVPAPAPTTAGETEGSGR